MSKVAKKPATKTSRASTSRPSIQTKSKASLKPGDKPKLGDKSKPEKKKPPEFAMPAFSILPKKKDKIDWEAIKTKTMRRQAPEGEDIKEIRKILKEVMDEKIPVHDFINLVSPYTGDNGAVLRTIMAEDEATFLKISRKVYQTMTQDVSDVLVNEQLQLVQYYEERQNLNTEKMMRAINEIYEMAPDFDFDKFVRDRGEYLKAILPIPIFVQKAPEDIELQRRQEAYHRLQWLRSEGERMSEENRRLQKRLQELKEDQKREQVEASEAAAEAEARRQELVIEEAKMKDQVNELNKSVEKTFIENEAVLSKQHNVSASTGAVKKPQQSKKKPALKKKKRPMMREWVSEVAAEMDEMAIKESIAAEAETAPPPPRIERVLETPRQRSPFHFSPLSEAPAPVAPPKQRSPFHFSPISEAPAPVAPPKPRSPFHFSPLSEAPAPSQPPRQRSPFHFSPISEAPVPSQPPRQRSPFHFSPEARAPPQPAAPREVLEDTRIERAQVRVQQARPAPQARPQGRRGTAPKDSWGGFY